MLDKIAIESWAGHRQGTYAALMGVLTKAHRGTEDVSRAERALFTACEFWAAVRNESLNLYLARNADAQLLAVEDSFAAMAMMQVAQIVRGSRLELATLGRFLGLKHVIGEISGKLDELGPRIDAALEAYAVSQVAAGKRAPR